MPDPLANSYYAATANPWTPQPALSGDRTCDVVVVGGGFTGLSAALACAEKGLSVVLLEAEAIGFGASGRNGGQLIPGLRWSMREIDAEFGRERARAIFDVVWEARDRVWDRVARHAIACDLKPGHLEAAYKPADFTDMQREAEFLDARFGYSTEVVARADLGRHIAGGNYHGGVYDPRGGHFHPLNYALGLARAALDAGVLIHERSQVVRLDAAGPVRVTTERGAISATDAILATDAWISGLDAALGRHTVPIMNYNVATAPLTDADALLPSDAAVADSRFVLNYFRLSADKRLIFGGGEKYGQRPPADIAAFVRRHIAQVFPALAEVPVDYGWGGAVAVTMNRLPHIGRKGSVFFAHGFSGHGALVTTLAGEILADAVTGTMGRFDVLARLPSQPFPGGRLLARPLATLGLLWYALRDRL
jgi:gamma-glutamylputrescine oxidase